MHSGLRLERVPTPLRLCLCVRFAHDQGRIATPWRECLELGEQIYRMDGCRPICTRTRRTGIGGTFAERTRLCIRSSVYLGFKTGDSNPVDRLDQMWLPTEFSWRVNERHYGALQGLNKAETAKKYGDEQVHIWRRSYAVRPPALEKSDPRYPGRELKYAHLAEAEIPAIPFVRW